MKKIIFKVVITLTLVFALPPIIARANLISNPGFEQGEAGWQSFKPENSNALMRILDNYPVSSHSGSGWAMIWPSSGDTASDYYGYYQRILNPTPNQPWRISGWIGSGPAYWSGNPQGWIQVEFYDNTEGGLEHRIWEADICTPRLSEIIRGYRYFESPIGYVPHNAKMVQVVTIVYCPSSQDAGMFGFDDLDLGVVPEPTTLILFGMGLVGLFLAGRIRKDSDRFLVFR